MVKIALPGHGYFELHDMGLFDVRGVGERLRVYELAGLGRLRTAIELARAHGFSRFVGRDRETDVLESALARVGEGSGEVVCVAGEAGIGKSRLLYEFAQRCREDRIEVWEGHCRARAQSLPLMPLLELLRSYFGIGERDTGRAVREQIAGRVLLLDPSLHDELPLLFDLLGVSDPGFPAVRIDPEARQRRLFAVLNRILATRSQRSVALFVFEDLQWIDPGSAAFLENLVDALPGTRTLVLASFRPPYEAEWMRRSYCGRLALAPLGLRSRRELLRDLLGADRSLDGLAKRIGERARGNPFFIEEFVRGLVDTRSLVGERGAYRLARPLEEKTVPSTVQAVIAARIDRLGEREKQLLQTAAVIGREFTERELRSVAGIAEPEAHALLRALLGDELIYERALVPEVQYAFVHQLIEEIAYHSQLHDRRARMHAHVAAALEELYPERLDELAARVSQHLEQADEPLAAARWGARAAAWTGFADPPGALDQWRRVSELSDAAPDSPEAVAIGIWSRIAIMNFGWRLGAEEQEITRAFEQARELAERSGDMRSRAMVLGMYAHTRVVAGDAAAYLDMHRESIRLADQAGDPALRVAMVGTPFALFMTGHLREALRTMEPAFALWAETQRSARD